MSGLNLHLDTFGADQESPTSPMIWVDMANMINTRFAVDVAAKKVVAVVTTDRNICNAVRTLKNTKSVLKTYGASESIMCIFNSGNTLADVIGMEIPAITSDNAKAVGIACCENIDETIVSSYEKVKVFFDQIVASAETFFTRLQDQTATQNAMIDRIISNITTDSIKVNAVKFNSDDIFGYTHPVFMERVAALQYINDNFSNLGTTTDDLRTLEPYMKVLGYKIVDTGTESLLEGDDAPVVQIVPETPKEAEQTAPEPAEVLNPQPVLQGDPAEVISTEEGEEKTADPVVTTTPVVPEEPADAPQDQTMAVFRWTPTNIVVAAGAVKNVLYSVPKFAKVQDTLTSVRDEVTKSIETIQADVDQREVCEAAISSGRSYAAFLGDVIAVYNTSVNELVDQVITMAGKLVSNISEKGVAASAITTEDPMGIDAKYINEEPASKPEEDPKGKQAEPSGEEPAVKPEDKPEDTPAEPETKNNVETPENVPNDKPLDDPAPGVDPNGEPEPGKAPHIEPTETPEGEQPGDKAEPFLGDVYGTRIW